MNPIYLLALACPIGMGLMMLLMGRGMMGMGKGDGKRDAMPATPVESGDSEKRLAVLQAQRALIDAQMAAMASESGADTASTRPADAARR